ncbi:MAG: phosphate/phosphite/phosphonate ABC transporter substrate-binding protein [Burkholderiales bacterium]|nr:phosphate/phosphite/phosphonate ABC transporter substrate-binding protein [Burkholderiales bacterium]
MMWSSRKCCRSVLFVLFMLAQTGHAAEPAPALRVGIVPYLSPNVLMSLFAPVREHLQRELRRPVELYTAPDVRSFVKKTLSPDYDVLISSAHLSRLAQTRGGYLPEVQFSDDLYGVIFVAKQSAIRDVADLRDKKLAVTDRTILVNIAVLNALSQININESKLRLRPNINQNTALLSIAQGDNDAAIAAHFAPDQMPEQQRGELREIFRTKALPNVIVSTSPKLPVMDRTAISNAMLTLADSTEGKNFLKNSRYGGVKKIDVASMKELDIYLPETLRQLGQ